MFSYLKYFIVKSTWTTKKIKGDIPSSRVHFCLTEKGEYGVLMGGQTKWKDDYIYHFFPKTEMWKKMYNNPYHRIGSSCVNNKDEIFVYGGKDVIFVHMN
jgi:hypothetical protein